MERRVALFRNGRSQAVRIPREFELPGESVSIERLSDGSLVIRPLDDLIAYLRQAEPLPESDWPDPVEDGQPEPVAF